MIRIWTVLSKHQFPIRAEPKPLTVGLTSLCIWPGHFDKRVASDLAQWHHGNRIFSHWENINQEPIPVKMKEKRVLPRRCSEETKRKSRKYQFVNPDLQSNFNLFNVFYSFLLLLFFFLFVGKITGIMHTYLVRDLENNCGPFCTCSFKSWHIFKELNFFFH